MCRNGKYIKNLCNLLSICHKPKSFLKKKIKFSLKIKVKISVANITFFSGALVVHFYLFSEKLPLATPALFRDILPCTLCSSPILLHPCKQLTLVCNRSIVQKTGEKLNRNNRWRSQVVTKKINNPCRKISRRE